MKMLPFLLSVTGSVPQFCQSDAVWIFNDQACSLILTLDNQLKLQLSREGTRQWRSWEDLKKLKNSYIFLLELT